MASWTSWTDLIDIPLGTTLYTSSWNTIFGPNGNEAHLKKYADVVTYEQETIYNLEEIVIKSGWPQGVVTPVPYIYAAPRDEYYITGDVTYPNWTTLGVVIGNYISLAGPAKYLAVLNIDTYLDNASLIPPQLLRIIISDTSGNLHLQKTISGPLDGPPDYSDESFNFPFLIDTNADTNLVIGFTLQEGLPFTPWYLKLKNSSSIQFHKLPALLSTLTATTSFVLGTTTLLGTSEF